MQHMVFNRIDIVHYHSLNMRGGGESLGRFPFKLFVH